MEKNKTYITLNSVYKVCHVYDKYVPYSLGTIRLWFKKICKPTPYSVEFNEKSKRYYVIFEVEEERWTKFKKYVENKLK